MCHGVASDPNYHLKGSCGTPSIIILGWSGSGIQLLYPDNSLSPRPPDECELHYPGRPHLVAYSADRTYIATTRQNDNIVTVIDHLSGTSKQFVDAGMKIKDIKVVGNTVFVVDQHKLVGWDLEADRIVHGIHGAIRVTVNERLAIPANAVCLILSHDCSQIAFNADHWFVSLYNVKTQKTISKGVDRLIYDIRFSLDGHQLYWRHVGHWFVGLEIAGDWSSTEVTIPSLQDGQLLFNFASPLGYYVGMDSGWVVDSRGSKVLWLPPNWKIQSSKGEKWDGNFLALVEAHHPEPIIIELKL